MLLAIGCAYFLGNTSLNTKNTRNRTSNHGVRLSWNCDYPSIMNFAMHGIPLLIELVFQKDFLPNFLTTSTFRNIDLTRKKINILITQPFSLGTLTHLFIVRVQLFKEFMIVSHILSYPTCTRLCLLTTHPRLKLA